MTHALRSAMLTAAAVAAGVVVVGQTAAPAFRVVTLWPKPLPNHWILGSITGVAVDARDHIWLVHRGLDSLTTRTEAGTGTTPQTAESCCAPAPPVLEFDADGNLLGHWGGPGDGVDWPVSPGGLAVDATGNVWIAAAGPPDPVPSAAEEPANAMGPTRAGAAPATATPARGRGAAPAGPPRPMDAHVLAFSPTGKLLREIGKPGGGAAGDSAALDRPADVAVDSAAHEVFVADGGTHQRVAVFDANTGAFKRHWTGHGTPFARLTCVTLAKADRVYVCDRKNNRIQVFKKDGTFVAETTVSKTTKGLGSVWKITPSADAAQRFLFVADGQDQRVFVLDRSTLQVVTSFGSGGRWPGAFYAVGSLAFDSRGNLYTGEMYEGKRLQKFTALH